MPELPEVEVVRQSLNKKIKQKKVKKVIVRNRNLRFKIPLNFSSFLKGQKIISVKRFSKYLILTLSKTFCTSPLLFCKYCCIIINYKQNIILNARITRSRSC